RPTSAPLFPYPTLFRSEILHEGGMHARLALEAVDALGAAAVEPALDVLDHHARIAARALERDRSRRHLDAHRVVVGLGHVGAGRSEEHTSELQARSDLV